MSLAITPAGEVDLPAIKILMTELLDAMNDTEGLDIEQAARNCREMLQDPAYHMLVARDNDRILGFVNFNTRKTILHPHESGLIDELIVSKSSRGSGIGRQLILAVIEECRRLGCSEVEVSTEKSNRNARRFYRACGFEEEAVLLEKQLEE
jgi:ribosomal protein S18 acetylase RimI-like enzyme